MRLQTHEVVLLFDTGTSMSWNDPAFLGPDALRQITSSLPSDWCVGLVTFNAHVVEVVPPGRDTRAAIHAALEDISYVDFSNPGVGLLQAAELFSDHALSRTIIFLTDGQNGPETKADAPEGTADLTEQAIAQIEESDIRVHMIVIGNNIENALPILGLVQTPGVVLLRDIQSEDLSGSAAMLTFGAMGIARSPQMRGDAGSFSVRLPVIGLDSASVLIMAESEITDIVVTDDIGQVNVQTGQRFALIEILNPTSQAFNITFAAYGNSSADMIAEWDLQLMSAVEGEGLRRFWLAERTGENAFINPFFARSVFPISINGDPVYLCDESRYFTSDASEAEVFQVLQTRLGEFGVNLPESIEIPVSELQPPYPDNGSEIDDPSSDNGAGLIDPPSGDGAEPGFIPRIAQIGIGIGLMLLAIIILIYLLVSRRKRAASSARPQIDERDLEVAETTDPVSAPQVNETKRAAAPAVTPVAAPSPAIPPAVVTAPVVVAPVPVAAQATAPADEGTFIFARKLDLYVIIGTIDDYTEDMSSRLFRFPRLGGKRQQSLQSILKKCQISNTFPGSDRIYFTADEQGALQIVNDSNCTVLVGSDVLAEKQPYTLLRREKVRIRDVYGTSELVISPRFLYRNL